MTRADVEEWLGPEDREDAERERATSKQARIAVASIVGVIATIAIGFLAIWSEIAGPCWGSGGASNRRPAGAFLLAEPAGAVALNP